MKIKVVFLSVFFAVIFSTCTYDVYNPDICFQKDILPIFVTKCSMNDCHNSGQHKAHYDLSTYEGIMRGITANHPLRSELYNSVTGIGASMPIGGKLSTKEISYIKIWIRMGAPNSTNCSACDTTAYTFSKRIQPLITSWCIGCHNQGSPGGGYDLSTYTGIKASIVAGRLLGTFRHDVGFSPMPQNSSKLSDCDVNAVVKWVNTGYPNN